MSLTYLAFGDKIELYLRKQGNHWGKIGNCLYFTINGV